MIEERTWFIFIKDLLSDLNYRFTEENNFLSMPFPGKTGTLDLIILVGEGTILKPTFLTVTGWLPNLVKSKNRVKVLEFLNTKNTEIPIGNFELHGEEEGVSGSQPSQIVYKFGIEAYPNCMSKEQLLSMLGLVLQAVDEIELEAQELIG